MCALCGVLGVDDHWSDAIAQPGHYSCNTGPHERRLERASRIRIANIVLAQFGMTLSDWQARSYLLSTKTGKTVVVDNLAHLWPTAEQLSGRDCDPLAPDLLEKLGDLT